MSTIEIPGSDRKALAGSRSVGRTSPDERLNVTVRLRSRDPLPGDSYSGDALPGTRTYLTRDELEARHGADPADIAQVTAFAVSNGLSVTGTSASRRSVFLSGTAQQFEQAFGVTLDEYEHPAGGGFRGRTGSISIPSHLGGIVVGVFGLDDRPIARPHIARLSSAAAATTFTGYLPTDVAKFYNFPIGVDGSGETIGIIELGGGFRASDLSAYFTQIGLTTVPTVTAVPVDNGSNSPSTANSADGEVMLDIEVAGAVAPGANIVVYFTASASDQDFLDAITQAVHDTTNNPSIISISWGGPEQTSTGSFQQQFNEVLQSAAALGITVTVASGDSGAADEGPNEWDGQVHADFPASSPYALACGGTNIMVRGGAIAAESVWNQNSADTTNDSFGSSGGGISEVFAVPTYQASLTLPTNASTGGTGRGVPDVSGDADPSSGYLVQVDGQQFPIGGTSAVAPLYAGLIALINQSLQQKCGFINPIIYANPQAFNDVTAGNNRVGDQQVGYDAGIGWDACTGLGSPNGQKLLAALAGSQAAS